MDFCLWNGTHPVLSDSVWISAYCECPRGRGWAAHAPLDLSAPSCPNTKDASLPESPVSTRTTGRDARAPRGATVKALTADNEPMMGFWGFPPNKERNTP